MPDLADLRAKDGAMASCCQAKTNKFFQRCRVKPAVVDEYTPFN